MSKLCRICGGEMPEDRKGWEQGHKELYDEYAGWLYEFK